MTFITAEQTTSLTTGALVDAFGRVVTDLRISVTDRCNFRCIYCMPAEGLEWFPRSELLTYEEIARFTRILVRRGIRSVRITGGEPLVRRDLPVLVRQLAEIDGVDDISMTTNGFLLDELAEPLRGAGMNRLNVSVDSLQRDRFQRLARRDALEQVMRGLAKARAVGFTPIKINAVAIRGETEAELLDFAELARTDGYQVRFIEFMPLDAEGRWTRQQVLTGAEIIERIAAAYPIEPVIDGDAPEPARKWRFTDGRGEIGIVASVSEPFCHHCDRIRITADGKLRNCLFSLEETDIRALLRGGADDDAIARAVEETVRRKKAGHLINSPDFVRPARSMSKIGG